MQTQSFPGSAQAKPESACAVPYRTQTEKDLLYNLVARQPFFHGLSEPHLQLLAASAMRTTFDAGHVILQRGDPANRFYLVLKGSVILEACDKAGAVHRLQRLGAGEVLGWSWLFPPCYWRFDAIAAEKTDAIFFYGAPLRAECQRDHEFGYEIMKRISQIVIARLQITRELWIDED